MSLRARLFVLFAALLVLLGAAELALLASLTRRLSVNVGEVAGAVGKRIVRFIGTGGPPAVAVTSEPGLPPPPGGHFFVYHTESKKQVVNGKEETETEIRVDADDASVAGGRRTRVLHLRGPNVDTTIPIPEGGVGASLASFRKELLLGSLGILGLGLLVAAVVADRISSPLHELARAARRVGEGELGARVTAGAGGELGEAIESFNRMSERLETLEREALLGKERQHLGELGDVARGLAHALRNPIHAVGLSLDELARRAGDGGDAEEIAETARRQIRRLDESIRSFLALTSGGSGAVEAIELGALVEDVVLSALQDARGRVRIELDRGSEPRMLTGIPAEVRAVVQALVVNAVEASPDGGVVRVAVAEAERGAAVTVDDDGPGLAPEVADRLFQPHVTTKANGSGMGLFLAQRIASTRYAGGVALEPRAPRGTRAVLTLRDRESGGGDA